MQDLPPEIWLHVLSFLPKGYERHLLCLNRFLYNKGLNEIYRKLCFSFAQDVHGIFERLDSMRSDDIGSRVQDLQLEISGQRRSRKRLLSRALTRTQELLSRPSSEVLRAAEQALPHSTGLNEVTLRCGGPVINPTMKSLLPILWKNCRLHLETLRMDMVLIGDLNVILDTCGNFYFPRLHKVEISLNWITYRKTSRQDSRTLTRLASFLSAHDIHNLAIIASEEYDFSGFFKSLPIFPKLKEITLEISLSSIIKNFSVIRAFFQNHSSTIEHLAFKDLVRLGPPGFTFSDPPLDVRCVDFYLLGLHFPRLQSLVTGKFYSPPCYGRTTFQQLLPGIHQLSPQLVKLRLTGDSIMFADFTNLMDSLRNCSGLRELRIKLRCLTTLHLDMLSEKVPHLQRLEALYNFLATDLEYENRTSATGMDVLFYRTQVERRYPGWALRELVLLKKYDYIHRPRWVPDKRSMQVVAMAFEAKIRFDTGPAVREEVPDQYRLRSSIG